MIPMTFHFTYYRGATDWKWLDFHTLCLKSCKKNTGAVKIVVHYDREDSGPVWDEARALGYVDWEQHTFDTQINGHNVTDQRIICDMFRLQTLWERGGWYCDLDFVFLGSFEKYRHHPAVIGTQCKQKCKLACGLMGAVPGAAFIRAYIDSYCTWTPAEQKTFWTYANKVPWDLSTKHPVEVLARPIFYPVAWSNKAFWKGGKVSLKNSVAIHLWETLHPELSLDLLRQTVLAPLIEDVLTERQRGVAELLPGVTLTFQ